MKIKNPINKSGQNGQTRVRNLLIEKKYSFREEKTGQSQIDFIISHNKFSQNVTDASVLNTSSISDNRFLRIEVKTN